MCSLCLQWVKPIGVRRKVHKYNVTLGRVLNLPPQLRNRPNKILLLGIFAVRWAKSRGGVLRMISGIGPDGEEFDEISLRSELLRLREGVEMEIPNDATGGMETWVVEIHLLGWLADLLGAHGLGPWPESFQARHACRDCWWHSGCWCAYLPKGSMEARAKRPHADGCRNHSPRGLQVSYFSTPPLHPTSSPPLPTSTPHCAPSPLCPPRHRSAHPTAALPTPYRSCKPTSILLEDRFGR